jgi:hypothetical protein
MVLGIFILIVVTANLMYLPSIVPNTVDFSNGDVMVDFASSNNELSYTNRHPSKGSELSQKEIKKWSHNIDKKREKEGSRISSSLRGVADPDGNLPKVNDETHDANPKVDEKPTTSSTSSIAGLNCDRFGGPDEDVAAEMVYWRDIPSDSHFASPYANYGESPKYLTFEPDEGGWNNIRMSMETATALAHAMGRILVLPFEQNMYLLKQDKKKENNRFTFKKFFPFDEISAEHKGVEVITMEEFMKREVMTGNIQKDGIVQFPPFNRTDWEGHPRDGKQFWHWLRNVTLASTWDFGKCTAVFPKEPGKEAADEMEKLYETMDMKEQSHGIFNKYITKPTPVNGPVTDRLKEMLSFRKKICLYNDEMQKSKVMHFMGDNNSGARLLVHFYAFLFFEDWEQDLWTKRYVRDHLRYIDEIQCAAAKIVHAVRQKAIENGNPDGLYDSMHVRRGDFQYAHTRIPATEIYENIQDVFIATDERNKTFFEPLQKHYNVLFLDDFLHLVPDLNKNYYGHLDQRIASRGRTFAGAYLSTFTGYITRMRGYHSQKEKLPGYEMGKLNSYFYVEKQNKEELSNYYSLKGPLWGREFPVAWRDIDHNLEDSHFLT